MNTDYRPQVSKVIREGGTGFRRWGIKLEWVQRQIFKGSKMNKRLLFEWRESWKKEATPPPSSGSTPGTDVGRCWPRFS